MLATLGQLQAKGDAWDIEGIIKLHNHLVAVEHKGLDVSDHKLLLPLEPQGTVADALTIAEQSIDEALFGGPVSVGLALQRIREFMQAATVKDCSLMLNFVHHKYVIKSCISIVCAHSAHVHLTAARHGTKLSRCMVASLSTVSVSLTSTPSRFVISPITTSSTRKSSVSSSSHTRTISRAVRPHRTNHGHTTRKESEARVHHCNSSHSVSDCTEIVCTYEHINTHVCLPLHSVPMLYTKQRCVASDGVLLRCQQPCVVAPAV